MKKSINYQDYLLSSLNDLREALGYLNAALEGGDTKVFLLAEKAHKSFTSLYKTLSSKGNLYFKNTNEILSAMGMHWVLSPL